MNALPALMQKSFKALYQKFWRRLDEVNSNDSTFAEIELAFLLAFQ